jgi:hypothetical protein
VKPKTGDLVEIIDETTKEGLWGIVLEKEQHTKFMRVFVFHAGRTMKMSDNDVKIIVHQDNDSYSTNVTPT